MSQRLQLTGMHWLAVLLLSVAASANADNGTFSVRDEWQPVDRILIATNPGSDKVSPTARSIIKLATSKTEILISDGDKQTQAKVIADLLSDGTITNANQVKIIDNPQPTSWARDFSPLVRFDSKNAASLTATAFQDFDQTTSLANISKTIKLPSKAIPTITLPSGTYPLVLDGGDWMTTDGGKTLITTTGIYDEYTDRGDLDTVKKAVDATLKKEFGIEKVIALQPLKEDPGGYNLTNAHVDLQVRTLPGRKVILARVPKGDVQFDVLDANEKTLTAAGYQVIRVDNAPQTPGRTEFKSYTNTLFLNGMVLIPSYRDAASDDKAKDIYKDALNGNQPANAPPYVVEKIDSADAIQFCGAVRCSAREIYRTNSKKEGPEASSRKNPNLSYDAQTGMLHFTTGSINYLGVTDGELSIPGFANDPLLGATLSVDDMILSPSMSAADRFAFVGGVLHLSKDGINYLSASVPVFSVYGTVPGGAMKMWGMLTDIDINSQANSDWLNAFVAEVLNSSSLLPDIFAETDLDLVALSNGFTTDVSLIELSKLGIVGNGTVSEPNILLLNAIGFLLLAVFHYRRHSAQVR